jgi:outer membrane protein assembly factor BamB
MRHRFAAVVAVALGAAALGSAQQSNTYSKAVPPAKATLDRLNLKTEWVQVIPVEGNRDTLTQVQTVGDQIFVQTRAGLFLALDALTGRIQWAARLGNGSGANSYPVAANATFVFVAHVTKLYAFYRYSGATEFVAELDTPPTVGLMCDEYAVYCVLGSRPGNSGSHRIAVYGLPAPIVVNEPTAGKIDPLAAGAKTTATVPVDELLKRYNPGAINPPAPEPFDPPVRPRVLETPVGGSGGGRTPSISTLPSVVPPYALSNRAPAPSLSALPSLRAPYDLRLESGRYIQQTASIGVIPPSIAASLLLTDLRPKAVAPPLRWEYGLAARINYPLNLTPTRAWAVIDGDTLVALGKGSTAGKVTSEVRDRFTSPIPAPPAQAGVTLYVPQGNGTLVAVDGTGGSVTGGARVKWRTDAGGINNHTPFVTKGFVYAAGDDSGVACVNRDRGEVVWRSDDNADRVIGANEEFVYVRDRQGRFLVYDAKRATDPADLSEFGIHVVNTASDRVYLVADNGLIVCVRDSAPKYAKPVAIWPAPEVNLPKRLAVESAPTREADKDMMTEKKP